jgi:hypothetical protein
MERRAPGSPDASRIARSVGACGALLLVVSLTEHDKVQDGDPADRVDQKTQELQKGDQPGGEVAQHRQEEILGI